MNPSIKNRRPTVHPAKPGRKELLSIIIPARNEEGNITRLDSELSAALRDLPFNFEFLVIDNASTDRTGEMIKKICDRDRRWKYVRFSKNFSLEMSLTAGYHLARGDAMVVLYSDLQDPPEVIPEFIEKWKAGYDVVYGVRTARPGDPVWRNVLVHIAYRLINWFSDTPMPNDSGDFRLITRQVRDALEECGETNRYLRGLIAWLGFRQIGVAYKRRARESGASKAPLRETFLFALHAITSFSVKPLRLFTFTGFIILLASLIAILVYSVLWLVGTPPPGITTLIVIGFVGVGLNSLGIGILGEYIGLIYGEAKARPKYIIQEVYESAVDRNRKSRF